jgi:uncharacterized protein YjiS (DUF1127 family)
MMTQPIQIFQNLTSETTPAGGNASKHDNLTVADWRLIELRARYARAEAMANAFGDAYLWIGRQVRKAVSAVKEDFRLRAAEAQLHRMSDRELSDLGLTRGDIHFALREVAGEVPQFDAVTAQPSAANQNVRRAA